MFVYLIAATALLTAPADVRVETLDGKVATGQLVELGPAGVKLHGGPVDAIAAEQLVSVTIAKPERVREKATATVELVDRSTLAITDYQAKGGTAHVTLAGGAKADLPTSMIRWVRFQSPGERNEKLAKEWAEMLGSNPAGDLIVIRKKGSIDYLEGKLGDVDENTTRFTVDGQNTSVARPKTEGMVYFHASEAELPEPRAKVADIYGTTLFASSASLVDDKLKLESPSGLAISLPFETVAKVDYSASKIQYLSDLEPEFVRYAPPIALAKELTAVAKFYAPRRDMSFERTPLALEGHQYAKGLALASRTTIRYHLPGKFRQFKAVAGIDDQVRAGGNVRVQIKGDGKILWDAKVSGGEKSKPLDLNVAGVKRLEILVDYGEDLDVADWFDLCEARVIK